MNNYIPLEISVITCTLDSGNELEMFQKFIAQNQNKLLTIPTKKLNLINYPTNSNGNKSEVNVIVQELYNYLLNLTYNGNIYLVGAPEFIKILKLLFTDALLPFP